MPHYEVKFFLKNEPKKETVEAENEAIAKQKIYALIRFHSVEEIIPPNKSSKDFMYFFNGIINK